MNHSGPGRRPCVSLLVQWHLTCSPVSAVALPCSDICLHFRSTWGCTEHMEHSRLLPPARQGAEEPPSSTLNWLQIQCSLTMCMFKPPQRQLGGFWQYSTVPCRCHQMQTVVINRYSLLCSRQEKEVLNKCFCIPPCWLHVYANPLVPHYLSIQGRGQRPFFQSLNWNNTCRTYSSFLQVISSPLQSLGLFVERGECPPPKEFLVVV